VINGDDFGLGAILGAAAVGIVWLSCDAIALAIAGAL
jgi:hypothetical protein